MCVLSMAKGITYRKIDHNQCKCPPADQLNQMNETHCHLKTEN